MDNKRTFTSAQQNYKTARYALLGLILVAVINIALLFAEFDIYFMSGVFLFYLLSFGTKLMGRTAYVLSAVLILALYVLCFVLSKRKRGWLVAALAMVCIDTLLLVFFALGSGEFITFLMDILYHGSALWLLGMGVKNGKAATGERDSDPYHPAEAPGQEVPSDDEEGPFTDAECTLSVSENGRRFGPSSNGVARFYETYVAFGMKNPVHDGILGSRLTLAQERLRFAYTDIDRARFTDVNEFNVQIDLVDGRACRFFLTRGSRPKLVDLLTTHGIAIEPYQ